MSKIKILMINGEKYVSLENLTKIIGKDFLKIDKSELIISSSDRSKDGSDQIHQSQTNIPTINELEVDYYWEKAAKENKRELFMNTIRPELKNELGYDFSEILLEEKAKLLCARWYFYEEKGEKYSGPYLIKE